MGTSEPGKRPPAKPGAVAEDTVPADSGPRDGWPVAPEPDEPRPSSRIDRYQFGPEIGRGGMGRVVEATDTRLGRKVAVKEALPRGLDLRRRFEREVRITARLEHPSIVPLYDAGTTPEGNPFYVMRKVSGRPLDKLIADAKNLGERLTLLPHLLAAIDAIAHAHRRGVVHRDMKPANVLVGEHGETVVIDWGLAKALGEDDDDDPIDHSLAPSDAVETQVGSVFGTPGFMAPEQARGESLDARSDVYALGATLYQLLSGRPPHSGTTATEVMDRALGERPPPLPALVPGVPPELVTITDKALAFLRDDRYPDAGALAEDVRRFQAGQLVAAHRYTPRQRIARFLRRHRAAVAVAALATVALAVGAALSVHGIVTERDRAMTAEHAAVAGQRAAEEARDRERDRADELLITQARALVDVNPTAALAALKLVSPTSPRLRNARMVAVSATARGAAWGYPGHGIVTGSLQLAPDGRRLLSAGEANGFRIHDLDRHEELLAVDFPGRVEAIWIAGGDAVLVAPRVGGLIRFDAHTGARTPLAWVPGIHAEVLAANEVGDHAYLVDDLGAVHVLDVATGAVTPLAVAGKFQSITVGPDGRWLMLAARDRLRVVRAADARVVAEVPGQVAWMVFAADGRRGAAIVNGYVVTVAVDGDRATITDVDTANKGTPSIASQVLFRGDQLLVTRMGRNVEVLGPDGAFHEWMHPDAPLMMGAESRGGIVAYGDIHGQLVLTVPHAMRAIRAPAEVQLKLIAARPDSRYVAIAAEDLILVWDLDRVTPTFLSVPDTQGLIFRDDNTLVVTPREAPWQLVDVRSGSVTKVEMEAQFKVVRRLELGPDGRLLIHMFGEGLYQLVPGSNTAERIYEGQPQSMTFLADGRYAFGTPRGELAIGTGRADRRVIAKEPASIDALIAVGQGVVALTASSTLIRYDGAGRELGRVDVAGARTGAIASDDSGRVLIGVGTKVVAWNGARLDDVAEFDAEVGGVFSTPVGIVAITLGGDTYVIGADRHPRRVLARTQEGAYLADHASMLLARLADGDFVVVDLMSSERAVLPGSGGAMTPAISEDGRRVAYFTGDRVALWNLDAPTEPDAWRPWLDEVTDAVPSTTPDVVWPWQTP